MILRNVIYTVSSPMKVNIYLKAYLQSFISLFIDRFTQSVKLGVDLYLESHNAFSEGNN